MIVFPEGQFVTDGLTFVHRLILSDKTKSFQSTCVIKTGFSDFQRMTSSVLKMLFRKLITYKSYNLQCFFKLNFVKSL